MNNISTEQVAEKNINVYIEAANIFKNCLDELRAKDMGDFTSLKSTLIQIISLLKEDDRFLMGLANTSYSVLIRKTQIPEADSDIILYGLNLAIYSLSISLQIGVPDEHLPYIGMAALCNHLGFIEGNSSSTSSELTETTEFSKKALSDSFIKITIDGMDIESLSLLSGLVNDNKLITTKTSVQESMYQYAIIVSLCSTYEKLMHKTQHGKYMPPADAMKVMRSDMDSYFNKNIIRIFFDKFSIYPVGTFVKLNTKETGKIVQVNEGLIMRPVVMIVLDPEELEKIPPVRINLKEKPNLYIKNSVIDEMLTEKYLSIY